MHPRNLAFASAVVAALTCFDSAGSAQAPVPNLTMTTTKVQDNIYLVAGGGQANSSFIVGQNGVIVIDTKTLPAAAKAVADEIAKVTNKPISTVIITHSDGDHAFGLPGLGKVPTVIVHENDERELEKQAITDERSRVVVRDFTPNRLVTQERENTTIEGIRMQLIHVANAHTSGDLAIYLPDQKLVFAGDLLGGNDPGIHLLKDGSSEGWIKFITVLSQLDADTYVIGHAAPINKARVQTLLQNARTKREKIAALVKGGKTLDEIRSEFGEKAGPVDNITRFPSFTENVYEELTKKN